MVDIQFKYGANNVPRMSDAEIERHAMLFIQDYNPDLLKTPQPLDVEDFAEGYLGLNFHYTNLSHTGFIWGRMIFNNTMIIVYDPEKSIAEEEPIKANTIVLDNRLLDEDREVNFRSTVMHECGHSVYHPEYYCIDYSELPLKKTEDIARLPYTHCRSSDIIGEWSGKRKKLTTDHDWLEHQAKHFSASTLMPKAAMLALCRTPTLQRYCFEKHPEFENDALVAIVAQTFLVSQASARIRIKQLKLNLISPNESPDSYFICGRRTFPLDIQYS